MHILILLQSDYMDRKAPDLCRMSEWGPGVRWMNGCMHGTLRHFMLLNMRVTSPFFFTDIVVSVATVPTFEKDEELESLYTTTWIFSILFLLSVCYSASVTLFKVREWYYRFIFAFGRG